MAIPIGLLTLYYSYPIAGLWRNGGGGGGGHARPPTLRFQNVCFRFHLNFHTTIRAHNMATLGKIPGLNDDDRAYVCNITPWLTPPSN